jgi:putative PIN family toxin of toxin-antitoxin system
LRRVLIDASTLVSGSADPHGESPPCLIFQELREMRFEPIICPRLLAEVIRGLRKPYFRDRVDEADIAEIAAGIAEVSTMLDDPADPEPLLRDPTDDYLVALARAAEAEVIVTGDKDLLDHPGLRPLAINARQACELLGLTEPS